MFGGQRGFVGHPLGYKALNVLFFYNITRLIMGKDTTQYKWNVLAWNCIGRDTKKWTLLESQWFDKKEECIADFQEKMKEGYDIVDSWGSEEYLLKRKTMPKKYCP